jgi:hypothetical protein
MNTAYSDVLCDSSTTQEINLSISSESFSIPSPVREETAIRGNR